MSRSRLTGIYAAAALLLATATASALTIDIVAGPGLDGAALGAFGRAAAQWEARIADPITVTVNADLLNLGSSTILGQASSILLIGGYDLVRDAMVADSSGEADEGIVSLLPTAAGFTANIPSTSPALTLGNGIIGTKANLKALGFEGLDGVFGVSDGTIEFNSGFSFDFDNSDGVVGTDFETVAAHEIGHTLGFISMVDAVDGFLAGGSKGPGEVSPTTLDLFRFAADASPSNAAEFSTFARELSPGVEAIFDDAENEFAMSTGALFGDGRQASHFKDVDPRIGIMGPTLGSGVSFAVAEADFRTLDVIGYDIVTTIPIPPTLMLFLSGIAGIALLGTGRERDHQGEPGPSARQTGVQAVKQLFISCSLVKFRTDVATHYEVRDTR